jgi:transposase
MKREKRKRLENELRLVSFKAYTPNQMFLFPPSLGDLIEPHHPVRVVCEVVDRMDISPLLKNYKGGGSSSYHPKMLLKVLIYGYLCNIYSSRRLESAVKESVHMMWLSGLQRPDHNTINRFRTDRLKGVVKQVFSQVVSLLVESGHVSLKQVYVDGTKIEANANRYTFVWGKSIETNKAKMAAQLEELWNFAESVAQEELKDKRPESFAPVDPEQIRKTIDGIDQALESSKKKVPPKVRQKLNYARKNWPQKIAEYNHKQEILAGRNSYSKTDHDATFMRMKEDHMQNGQLKPGYNLQVSSSEQIIVNYSIHQDCTDSPTFPDHLSQHKELHGEMPLEVIADAGYGSEENYALMDSKGVEAFVKYNMFDKEQQGKSKLPPFSTEALYYNPQTDTFTCPMGQEMRNIGKYIQLTATGYQRQVSRYQAIKCESCPLRGACHKQKGNRIIEVSLRARKYREDAARRLKTEKGIAHRKKRSYDIESVFGNIKQNKGFRRFLLRGIEKVEIEAGLVAIAHNIQKIA